PTAVHESSLGHAIALSSVSGDPGNAGTGWRVQALPFQPTANGRYAPPASCSHPTAVHHCGDRQSTPWSAAPCDPAVSGGRSTLQWVPSQRAMSGAVRVETSRTSYSKDPTATQETGDAHDTACRKLSSAAEGLGVMLSRQFEPSQSSE